MGKHHQKFSTKKRIMTHLFTILGSNEIHQALYILIGAQIPWGSTRDRNSKDVSNRSLNVQCIHSAITPTTYHIYSSWPPHITFFPRLYHTFWRLTWLSFVWSQESGVSPHQNFSNRFAKRCAILIRHARIYIDFFGHKPLSGSWETRSSSMAPH